MVSRPLMPRAERRYPYSRHNGCLDELNMPSVIGNRALRMLAAKDAWQELLSCCPAGKTDGGDEPCWATPS